jgi:23S rRNA (adenine2503-C2)-methyltransferase
MATLINALPTRYIQNDLRPTLVGLNREALAELLGSIGVPEKQRKMRANQLWHWIYHKGTTDFAAMSNIAKELRLKLEEAFQITEQVSNDGTRKWLFRFRAARRRPAGRDRDRLHSRRRPRHALHLQPGRLHAHLLVLPHRHAEAGAQPHGRGNPRPAAARARPARRFPRPRHAGQGRRSCPAEGRAITNIVMMGMGEPLYNFDNVKRRC